MEPWFGAVTPENRDEFVSLCKAIILNRIEFFKHLSSDEKIDYINAQARYRQEVNKNQTRMSRASPPEEGSEAHTISEQAMLREIQERFISDGLHQQGLFSVPQVQIERSLFDELAAFGFTRQILNQWQPAIREAFQTSENSARRMVERHVNILIFLREQGLSPEQAIIEINSLNTYEAWDLTLLYSLGLRGEHIRVLKNHFSTLYPDIIIGEQIGNALQDLIQCQHQSVSDAVEEIKRLDGNQMISHFSVD